jgi:hypothetical protein
MLSAAAQAILASQPALGRLLSLLARPGFCGSASGAGATARLTAGLAGVWLCARGGPAAVAAAAAARRRRQRRARAEHTLAAVAASLATPLSAATAAGGASQAAVAAPTVAPRGRAARGGAANGGGGGAVRRSDRLRKRGREGSSGGEPLDASASQERSGSLPSRQTSRQLSGWEASAPHLALPAMQALQPSPQAVGPCSPLPRRPQLSAQRELAAAPQHAARVPPGLVAAAEAAVADAKLATLGADGEDEDEQEEAGPALGGGDDGPAGSAAGEDGACARAHASGEDELLDALVAAVAAQLRQVGPAVAPARQTGRGPPSLPPLRHVTVPCLRTGPVR